MIDHTIIEPHVLVGQMKSRFHAENLSLNELERQTGIARQTLAKYLTGGALPIQLKVRKKISDWLNGAATPAPVAEPSWRDQTAAIVTLERQNKALKEALRAVLNG